MIKITNLNIKFDKEVIFENFCVDIYDQITVILGENGSGKTTLLKAIVGLISFEGIIEHNYKISFAPTNDYLYDYLSSLENIKYFANIFEEDSKFIPKCKSILTMLNFKDEYYVKNVLELSIGNRCKLFLAIVLARDCDLFILDEAFSSLDKDNQIKILDYIKNMNKFVIYTTHIHEFEKIAKAKIQL